MEIGIVGTGFCGMMTAVNLILSKRADLTIHIIDPNGAVALGPAYQTKNARHLLNVKAGNMGCFSNDKAGFVNWIGRFEPYSSIDKTLLSEMFLPRYEFGRYLTHVWHEIKNKNEGRVKIIEHSCSATDCLVQGERVSISLSNGSTVTVETLVLATGNDIPSNPPIANSSFFTSKKYHANPWSFQSSCIQPTDESVLILGNGLTMADVVLTVYEKKFRGITYTISPHGFAILPHRHNGTTYNALKNELKPPYDLNTLFILFRKHIKFVRQFGMSAEPVVDSIRSLSQEIWMNLSLEDKKRFMRHVRHLWGLARHRLPAQVHDFLYELRLSNKLKIIKGRVLNLTEESNLVIAEFYNSKTKQTEAVRINQVINCTGPSMNIEKSKNPFLKSLVIAGHICADELRIGIKTNLDGAVINTQGRVNSSIYTLGGNLRGMYWETTAVPELRVQTENLAKLILKN